MKEQLEHDKQLGLFKRIVKFNWLTKEGRANRLERARAEKELNEEVDSGRYAKYQKISLENKEIRDGMLGLSAGKDEERQDKMATLDKMVTLIDRTNTWNYDRKNQKDLDDPDYDYAIRYTYRPKISSDDGEQIFYSMMLEDWCQSREGQTRRELMSDKRRDQFVRNVVKNTDWRLA